MIELPTAFEQQMRQLIGSDYDAFHAALSSDPAISVRINASKCSATANGIRVPWNRYGYYLSNKEAFTFDPLWHAGAYYVQEASSMIISTILRQTVTEKVKYLDLCAAPGGKSTDALASLPSGSLVVSNEYVNNRAGILRENIIKWGSPYSVVTNDSPANIGRLTHFFDVVAVDAPCSGEGMFRKDANSISEWSLQNVAICAERQRSIIDDIWNALRPGGLMIYSTCTYNSSEDEDMVQYIIDTYQAESVKIDMDPKWNISEGINTVNHCYRFMPHHTRGEGLFVAVIRKSDNETYTPYSISTKNKRDKDNKRNKSSITADMLSQASRMLLPTLDMLILSGEYNITALPKAYAADIAAIRQCAKVIYAGVEIATVKGRDIAPAPALALSTACNHNYFPSVELAYNDAVTYLRHEAITLPPDAPRGYVCVCYHGAPLGWVKNIGNRANNLYAQEWRIRSTYAPDSVPEVITDNI